MVNLKTWLGDLCEVVTKEPLWNLEEEYGVGFM